MENPPVQIVDYSPKFQADFRTLNKHWIDRYFTMEELDYKALDHPQTYIIDPGGAILVACRSEKVLGVCALIKMKGNSYELAKMAVSDEAQGQGIGFQLGQAVIEKARSLGANRVYLETNDVLKPALALYRKLGFNRIESDPSPYARSNVQMELIL